MAMAELKEILRSLRREDVPAAFELSAQAGWNQTEADWTMLLDLAPDGCWAVEISGELAATTTLVCYGRRLAWIGMVLTKTEFRRKGLAKKLLVKALEQAAGMGVETIKLDATDQGRPLYERFGFRAEREIERWSRTDVAHEPLPVWPPAPAAWRDSDHQYFGADRSLLLERLAKRHFPFVQSRSYLFARPGRMTSYLGPCVGENPEIARRLITTCVKNSHCGWMWDLFPGNSAAVSIARDLGFAPQRHLLRMVRGKELQQDRASIYAIAGFELG
jgi:GNAT superfamily N-acetyltransferase